ncbi:MAG: hypothetical protein KDD82_25530 [Planctomycetes bacterium]|nr:hypothetical protein [Planctomycetota bacterium]
MAVDEALLEAFVADPEAAPVLRVYGWSPAGFSLGRFQPADDLAAPPGAEVVRRLSGGAAIYHQSDELTYSVVARYRDLGGGPKPAYALIHGLIGDALAALGAPIGGEGPRGRAVRRGLCYAHPTDYDLLARGVKLVGSAQRRRGSCFLQHGSIPWSPHPDARGTSLSELMDPPPTRSAVVAALVAQFGARWTLVSSALSRNECAAAETLERTRYGSDAWSSG